MNKYARFLYHPCLPLGKDGRRVTSSDEHIALSRSAAGEGAVLLKNDGTLPLSGCPGVALFGKATVEYIKGGGGSGDVNCAYVSSVYDGFCEYEQKGLCRIFMPLVGFYLDYAERSKDEVLTDEQISARWDIVNNMPFCQYRDDLTYDTFQAMHVKETQVPDELIDAAAGSASVAVFTLSRFSAEGTDRRVKGGDYILSEIEQTLLQKLCEKFDKVVIVLDSGAVVDCEAFQRPEIGAVLLSWHGGMEGGRAVADVLFGEVNPSGRLPDTIVKSYDDYPSKADYEESFDYLNYSEDIYVGYRYFTTIPGKSDCIRYPFGYGLSYTSFEEKPVTAAFTGKEFVFEVSVKNTGEMPGKNVTAVYVELPQCKCGAPARQLAAFGKTKMLEPGQEQLLTLSFDKRSVSLFDDAGEIAGSAFVFVKGVYRFYLGADVLAAEKLDFRYENPADEITEQCSPYCLPVKPIKRLDSSGSFSVFDSASKDEFEPPLLTEEYVHTDTEVPFVKVGDEISLSDFVNQFTVDEMIDFIGGQPTAGVANTGCFGDLKRLGVPAFPTADGPAGLRLEKDTGISTTAFPCATCLAATWDEELVYSVGRAAAGELRENNIAVWLAPAVNIHRSPLCGRNFEYFSEDPLLAGMLCAAEINGIQSMRVAASLKHFCANNKEPNRFGVDSRMSARALREIYLRPFEIVVKNAKPLTVMSSYNLLNGTHTSENKGLLTGILRTEWGFEGMVESDWGQKNDPAKELWAGNDLKMPVGFDGDIRSALDSGFITTGILKLSVMRILSMFVKLEQDK